MRSLSITPMIGSEENHQIERDIKDLSVDESKQAIASACASKDVLLPTQQEAQGSNVHLSASDTSSLRDVVVDGDRDRDAYGDARREEMNSLSGHFAVEAGYVEDNSEENRGEGKDEGDGGGEET